MAIIPKWSLTVSHILATPAAEVWIQCSAGCFPRRRLDMARLVMDRNPLFCLWDRRPPCPTCGRAMIINGHHAPDAFVFPLIEGDASARLHARWRWLRDNLINGC